MKLSTPGLLVATVCLGTVAFFLPAPAAHPIAAALATGWLGEPGAPVVVNGYERLAWAALASAAGGG